ncbi:integrase arm-type DNA-binding domain-containing protein [Pseudodesulfovibrio sp. zrk46]|uniref:tyrosine-type recombinase/integrase n=1 Tax=Pseudodesulfovibrio sp. zrk46 TaxID=2725288 RepID=UPI001449A1C8|nr:integrase arm-type DNA-binding domain-containing protein [Pseudodesulfovibrio sp. zrk46]QJB57459.1 integrase arm-type DNA-binding domain-containing protein [Pseudodesulfovibrio sp. zrk46]
MPLTDAKIKAAKPKTNEYTLNDGEGLALVVSPKGRKWWRFRYQMKGKRTGLSLGTYPYITLQDARTRRSQLKTLIAQGIDPSRKRKEDKRRSSASEAFEAVAREWFQKNLAGWSGRHAKTTIERLEKNVFPFIGERPISELGVEDMLGVVQRCEKRGAVETARRVRQIMSQIFRYAVAAGRAERDPAADIKGAIPPARKVKHHPSITDPKEIGPLLRAIDSFSGTFVVHCALRFAPLVFVRPGELRNAEWNEIDLEACEWRIPESKMKGGSPHIVPLSKQAVAILIEVYKLTGPSGFVFPSIRTASRPMSENTINVSLRRLGYDKEEMTGHGFRSMASTLLNEHGWHKDAIERQLAHTPKDKVRASYNYAEHLPERKKMMQAWADYLDSLKAGGKVVPLFAKVN